MTANGSYDGASNANLLVGTDSLLIGAKATISITIQYTPNGETPPFFNSATATARGTTDPTSDISDDGTDPDPDGDGNPNEAGENDPTPVDVAPGPLFSKSFAPDEIATSGISRLTFKIDNTANATPVTGLDFTDSLPAGVTVAPTPNVTNTCTGGTVTAAAGTSTFSYNGGFLSEIGAVLVGFHG